MIKPQLKPTADQTFVIVADEKDRDWNFADIIAYSRRQEQEGDIEGACNTRFHAFQRLEELIPDNGETILEWNDQNSQAALVLIHCSAIDHFLIGDWEMCAAMLEMLLELDPEDHLEATIRLAYSYLAMEEYDSFDDIANDISDKFADKEILTLWSAFRRTGQLPVGEVHGFCKRFRPYYTEFTADEHPVDDDYIRDVDSENPRPETLARELWLQTEHLWSIFPGFIEALKAAPVA